MALEDVEKDLKRLKSDLGHINEGPKNKKYKEQLDTIKNIKNLYQSRGKVTQIFNNYAKNMSRNIDELKQGTGLRQIVYSLY